MKEYSYTIVGLLMSGIFGVLGMIFLIFKEKACILISGYNFKSKKERAEYDEVRLSKDERNFFFRCAMIFFIGAVISIFADALSFWIVLAIWFIYLLKNVHINEDKAFGKYKKGA